MGKTEALRKVVTSILRETDCEVYYEKARKDAEFPYVVYTFDTINFDYYARDDIFLLIEVWDKNKTSSKIEEIADLIENLLNYRNHPTDEVLPTFYLESRKSVEDEDATILHRQIRVKIENYYIGGR